MAENKLSDVQLRALTRKVIVKPFDVADGGSLSIRVTPSRRKVIDGEKRPANNIQWLFRYKNKHKSANTLTLVLGKYPAISLADARRKRDQCKRWLAHNLDPKDQFEQDSAKTMKPVTVREAMERWIDEYAAENRVNFERHRRQFERHIYPYIGDLPLEQCSKARWMETFNRIKKVAPVASGYILGNCKQALIHNRRLHDVYSNALEDIKVTDVGRKQAKRDRVLTSDELLDLWSALQNECTFLPYYTALIKLLIVFGARTQEIRLSTWSEWNIKEWIWTVPKEHSKGGAKIIRPVPETIQPFILQLRQNHLNSGLLLGEMKKPEAVSQWGRNIYSRLEHSTSWTLHDLRRTFATGLNSMGVAPHVVEQLLGHSMPGVMAVYNHSQYIREKRAALEQWAKYLEKIKALKTTN
ncbi:tyrosine-type recombinase/integrase [Cronobacter sakazakii]|uniref:tyrosine-type recombinase/integrase n=1 Tax=Cronobacter sakazakii TaxID=28141 RepID=UPI000CF18DCD|nr:site-specific integrase [Cronobacter sakazakii]EIX1656620.1 tyrosine-type recombinase/integrase [Cronobacter sakazakii]EIX1762585.1 tyrosine-type recombinase/integrase [Cronobacter sakazakii]EIX6120020.1 tyrosine-type recombinase/integrase [Cronobacter sakazakii]EIX6208634.1 tyrosine-type recombinase/integrase [Cronobacter sakazakii]EJQ0793811.1 tyrosine-type recombinase/integrase [Cronobacter sakazakii]